MISIDVNGTGSFLSTFSGSAFFERVRRNDGKFHLNNPAADGFVINSDSPDELNGVDIFTTDGVNSKAIFIVQKNGGDHTHTVMEATVMM